MTKFLASLALMLVCGIAQAAGFTVFDNIEACKNAAFAGKAQSYTPKTKAPFVGTPGWTNKVVGVGGACLGQAHVLEDGASRNGKAVYVSEGFVYWEHTSGAFRMHDCSNPFGEIAFIRPAPAPTPQAVPAPAAGQPTSSCTTDDCGNKTVNVVEKTIVNRVTEIVDTCVVNGVTIQMQNNICQGQVVRVTLPVKVETSTTSTCNGNCGNSNGPQRPTAGPTTDAQPMRPALTITGRQPRTDGRCVFEVKDKLDGQRYFIRFALQDGEHLKATKVTDEVGNQFVQPRINTFVGDGKSTVRIHGKDCDAAVRAFSSDRALKWTASQLGLRDCEPVGIVNR